MIEYHVVLSNGDNPDYDQDGTRPLSGVPVERVPIETLADAVRACREYIGRHKLGGGNWNGGNWNGGQIMVNERQVAYISYNGRVWNGPIEMPECGELHVSLSLVEVVNLSLYPDQFGFTYRLECKGQAGSRQRVPKAGVEKSLAQVFASSQLALDALRVTGELHLDFVSLYAVKEVVS